MKRKYELINIWQDSVKISIYEKRAGAKHPVGGRRGREEFSDYFCMGKSILFIVKSIFIVKQEARIDLSVENNHYTNIYELFQFSLYHIT